MSSTREPPITHSFPTTSGPARSGSKPGLQSDQSPGDSTHETPRDNREKQKAAQCLEAVGLLFKHSAVETKKALS